MDIIDDLLKMFFGREPEPVPKKPPPPKKCYDETVEAYFIITESTNKSYLDKVDRIKMKSTVGYINISEYGAYEKRMLNPYLISILFFDNSFVRLKPSLKHIMYLTMLVPIDSKIDNVYVVNKEYIGYYFEIRKEFRYRINADMERLTLILEMDSVTNLRKTYDTTVSSHMNLSLDSLLWLSNTKDELTINYQINLPRTTIDYIKEKAVIEINEKADSVAKSILNKE